jgi:hypothetical protein
MEKSLVAVLPAIALAAASADQSSGGEHSIEAAISIDVLIFGPKFSTAELRNWGILCLITVDLKSAKIAWSCQPDQYSSSLGGNS